MKDPYEASQGCWLRSSYRVPSLPLYHHLLMSELGFCIITDNCFRKKQCLSDFSSGFWFRVSPLLPPALLLFGPSINAERKKPGLVWSAMEHLSTAEWFCRVTFIPSIYLFVCLFRSVRDPAPARRALYSRTMSQTLHFWCFSSKEDCDSAIKINF